MTEHLVEYFFISVWWCFFVVYSYVILTNETLCSKNRLVSLIKNAQINVLVKSQFGFGYSYGCCAVLIVVKREKIAKAKQGTSNL